MVICMCRCIYMYGDLHVTKGHSGDYPPLVSWRERAFSGSMEQRDGADTGERGIDDDEFGQFAIHGEDAYALLRCHTTALPSELRLAYLKRVREEHPDKGGDADRFKTLKDAFDVLKDEGLRAAYDEGIQHGASIPNVRSYFVDGARCTWLDRGVEAGYAATLDYMNFRREGGIYTVWLRFQVEERRATSGAAVASSAAVAKRTRSSRDERAAASSAAAAKRTRSSRDERAAASSAAAAKRTRSSRDERATRRTAGVASGVKLTKKQASACQDFVVLTGIEKDDALAQMVAWDFDLRSAVAAYYVTNPRSAPSKEPKRSGFVSQWEHAFSQWEQASIGIQLGTGNMGTWRRLGTLWEHGNNFSGLGTWEPHEAWEQSGIFPNRES